MHPFWAGKMGVATTAAPYGFWATNPTKKLAHWVYLLGRPLSRNRVFQNFSGEPPPPPLKRLNDYKYWHLTIDLVELANSTSRVRLKFRKINF